MTYTLPWHENLFCRISSTDQQNQVYLSLTDPSPSLQLDMSAEERPPRAKLEGGGASPPEPAPTLPPVAQDGPFSPTGSTEGASSNEEDEVVMVSRKGGKSGTASDQEELIPIPPPVPKNGMTILSHKLWIGNLDKRLTECVGHRVSS